MEPISLILAALLAGAAKGAGQTAAEAVQDAYRGLRDALKRRLAGKPAAEQAVEQYTESPDDWKSNLEVHLRQAGADRDQALLDAAALVLRQADPAGAATGKYVVNLAGSQGVQIGDHNQQRNDFGSPPPR
jgi:RIP homotypic interaction motif (RHIM)-containing protein